MRQKPFIYQVISNQFILLNQVKQIGVSFRYKFEILFQHKIGIKFKNVYILNHDNKFFLLRFYFPITSYKTNKMRLYTVHTHICESNILLTLAIRQMCPCWKTAGETCGRKAERERVRCGSSLWRALQGSTISNIQNLLSPLSLLPFTAFTATSNRASAFCFWA